MVYVLQVFGSFLCPLCGKTYKYEYNLFYHWRRTCRDLNGLIALDERRVCDKVLVYSCKFSLTIWLVGNNFDLIWCEDRCALVAMALCYKRNAMNCVFQLKRHTALLLLSLQSYC